MTFNQIKCLHTIHTYEHINKNNFIVVVIYTLLTGRNKQNKCENKRIAVHMYICMYVFMSMCMQNNKALYFLFLFFCFDLSVNKTNNYNNDNNKLLGWVISQSCCALLILLLFNHIKVKWNSVFTKKKAQK